jgi:hypothetical protein
MYVQILVASTLFSIVVTPTVYMYRKISCTPYTQKKRLEKATRRGHVVNAKFSKCCDATRLFERRSATRLGEREWVYHYECNGKTYEYRTLDRKRPPDTLELYFERSPRKACRAEEIGVRKGGWTLTFFVVFAIFVAMFSYL